MNKELFFFHDTFLCLTKADYFLLLFMYVPAHRSLGLWKRGCYEPTQTVIPLRVDGKVLHEVKLCLSFQNLLNLVTFENKT